MSRAVGYKWIVLGATLALCGGKACAQVLTFSPLLRSQFVADDPHACGWDLELGASDSAATWWAGLHYARMSSREPFPDHGYEVRDVSGWLGVAGGPVCAFSSEATLEYGIRLDHVQLQRSLHGTVEATAIALGATARMRILLGDVMSVYVGWDAGYRKMQEQLMANGPVDRPFSDAPYFGVLAGLKLTLQ